MATFIFSTFNTLVLNYQRGHQLSSIEPFWWQAESTHRCQFEKSFDYAQFNEYLISQHGSRHYVAGFDPRPISKSGKKTSQRGYF
jgi:hypothetical protein